MAAPGGTHRRTLALHWSAGRPPRWPRLVLRIAFVLVASAGLSIAFTQGAAAADPLLPAPDESLSELTDSLAETVAGPLEAAAGTTETAADAIAPAVDAVTPIVQPATDTLEPATDSLEPVVDTLAAIAEPIGDVVAPVLAPIVDASAPVTDQVVTILEPVEDVITPITEPVADTPTVVPRILRPTDLIIDPLQPSRSMDRIAAARAPAPIDTEPVNPAQRRSDAIQAPAPGTIGFAAPAPPAVIAFAEPAAVVRPLPVGPDRPVVASSTPISSAGNGGAAWTPMAVFGTLLLLGLVSRALITTALLRPPAVTLLVPVPPG